MGDLKGTVFLSNSRIHCGTISRPSTIKTLYSNRLLNDPES